VTINIPVDVIISSKNAELGERKAVRSLENIRSKANQTKNTNKDLETSFRGVGSGIAAIDGPLGGISSRFTTVRSLVQSTGFALAAFTVGLTGAGFAMRASVREAVKYSTSLAEVKTLVGDTFAFDTLSKSIRQTSKDFGQLPTQQAKAAYQIISAGASSAAEATSTLVAANKLAIGGVTEVSIAADGLTTIMNSYGDRVGSATDVSDALFVAMRAGKTTIGELSASIGKVAPLAAQTNTSLAELLSGIAALTKGGIKTTEAVTGMRAALAAIAKPTKEASDLAQQLGIDFNAAGLESKGFAAFMQEIAEKTGGSTEKLSQLFGGVEALIPVLALSGAAGEDFKQILEDMGSKAGETEEAFNKMASTPQFVFGQLRGKFVDLAITIGDAVLTVIIPATKTLIDNFDNLLIIIEALSIVVGSRLVISFGLATAAIVRNTIAAAGNFIAMSRLTAAVGGVATAHVVAASAMAGMGKIAAVIAGPLALGAAIVAYVFLRNKVSSATDAMNSFVAIGVVVGAEMQKLGSWFGHVGRMVSTTFSESFGDAKRVLDAFKSDLTSFITNPFSSTVNFNATGDALLELTTTSFTKAIENSRDELEARNKTIDQATDRRLLELSKQNQQAAKDTDEFSSATEDANVQLQTLIEKLNNDNNGVTGALEQTTEATKEATKATKEYGEESSKVSTIVTRAAENIFDIFSSSIDDFLAGDLGSWKDYGDRIVDVIRGSVANISALALAKPIIVPIIGKIAGTIGLGGQLTNQIGNEFGVNNLVDMAKQGSGIYDMFTSGGGALADTILPSSVASVFDTVGYSVFNTGTSATAAGATYLPAGVSGPIVPDGTIFGGASNAINPINIGAGMVGNLASDLLGLSGEYSDIGSAAGTAIAALAGFTGPLAFSLAAFGGSALGGLFGGKPSDKGQWTQVNRTGAVVDQGGLSGKKFSQENQDASLNFAKIGSTVANIFEQVTNDKADFENFKVKIGNRDSYDIQFDDQEKEYVERDPAILFETIVNRIREQLEELPANIATVVDQIDFTDLNGAVERLDFIGLFDAMFKEQTVETFTQTEVAIDGINERFQEMISKMTEYGFIAEDIQRVEDLRVQTLQQTKDALEKTARTSYFNAAAPGVTQFRGLYDNYQNQLSEFNSVGLDTTFLDKSYQVQQEKLIQSIVRDTYSERLSLIQSEAQAAERLVVSYSNISSSLKSAILNLRLDSTSPLTTEQRLAEARSNFLATAGRASTGDIGAMGELDSLGSQFLEISRGYFASTDQYVQDFNTVQEALESAKNSADAQLTTQQKLVELAQEEIDAINNMSTILNDSLTNQERVSSIINQALQVGKMNANETLVQGINSGLVGEDQLSQILPVFDSLGAPGADGVGGRSLFFESNPAANAAFIQAARSLGIPGFNKGGDVLGNGLFMVGETRPEIFQAGGSGGKVIPLENGAEVEQRLANLEREMRAMVGVSQEGYKRLEQMLERQVEATEENTEAVKRQS